MKNERHADLYFNDNERFLVDWTLNLYPGATGDARSIRDVEAGDLVGHRRVHLFSGIGGWQYALELAGWPRDFEVWTGSCPCQPYSTSGKRLGDADERNLWPEMYRLIRECRPDVILGEQVEAAIRHGWLDGVFADLEREGYACGAAVLGAHSVGAPHIRQRIYWGAVRTARLAHPSDVRRGQRRDAEGTALQGDGPERAGQDAEPGESGQLLHGPEGYRGPSSPGRLAVDRLVDSINARLRGHARDVANGRQSGRQPADEAGSAAEAGGVSAAVVGVAHSGRSDGISWWSAGEPGEGAGEATAGTSTEPGRCGNISARFWDDYAVVALRDGTYRRTGPEPGAFPLAARVPSTVGRIRAYGNAIVPQLAAEFVRGFAEAVGIELELSEECGRGN